MSRLFLPRHHRTHEAGGSDQMTFDLPWFSFAHSADVVTDTETDVAVVTTVGDTVRYTNPFPAHYEFTATDGGSFQVNKTGMYQLHLVADFRVEDTDDTWRAVTELNVTLGSASGTYLNGNHPIKVVPHLDVVSSSTNIVLPTTYFLHLTAPPYGFQVRLYHDAPADAAVQYYVTVVRLSSVDVDATYSNELPL